MKEEKYFTTDQVREFDGRNGKPMFITFRGSVYDVSKFKHEHPGGHFIEQAAGGDVEPFWKKWAYHYQSKKVLSVLMENRIGTLVDSDADNSKLNDDNVKLAVPKDLYNDEPIRTEEHSVLMERPFASQTKPEVLKRDFLTPSSALYIRHHAPVPTNLDFESHEIHFSLDEIIRKEDSGTVLSLSDMLSKYKQISVISVLQCAGNRASESIKNLGISGFNGTPFEKIQMGMVGNVLWSGISLKEVMENMAFENAILWLLHLVPHISNI